MDTNVCLFTSPPPLRIPGRERLTRGSQGVTGSHVPSRAQVHKETPIWLDTSGVRSLPLASEITP